MRALISASAFIYIECHWNYLKPGVLHCLSAVPFSAAALDVTPGAAVSSTPLLIQKSLFSYLGGRLLSRPVRAGGRAAHH